MSSPGQSSGTTKPADLFDDLWRQLGDCHQNALQELEVKVSKLKKDRCLDAQKLEVFYNRNQQLKEQNKTLQDAISLLEERLRTGECGRCAILEENFKNHQHQNLQLIAKLKNEKICSEDENRKLHSELQKLKMSRSELHEASSEEQEEGIIPDSPILSSSMPVANRLKKRKNINKNKHVRYAEMPLPKCNNSLFNEINKEPTRNPGRGEVLVPNTCELDTSQIAKDVNDDVGEEVIAETCALELLDKRHMKTETTARQQSSSKSAWKHDVCLTPDSTTERSPSLLQRVKRFSEDNSICKAKRKKEESDQEVQEGNTQGTQGGADKQKEGKHLQPELANQTISSASNQSFKKEFLDSRLQVQSAQAGTLSQKPGVSLISPAFKRPNSKVKRDADGAGQKRSPLQDLNASHNQPAEKKQMMENMWSLDPALALSMYDSEWRRDEAMEEEQHHGELADTDCTWVSHSLLQGRTEDKDRENSVPGLGEKANDSLDMMFDTTAYGEYKSFNSSHLGHSQPCDDDDDDDDDDDNKEEEEEKEEEDDDEQDPCENSARQSKARHPTFAHVAVVRKKDERRKLKGSTCKECEIYYAHLPEEDKQKKLAACSRHRFLYVPPCTPENFWEVGFPSTQTCIERGYIKEDKNPEARLRRRQPLTALFTPKKSHQES